MAAVIKKEDAARIGLLGVTFIAVGLIVHAVTKPAPAPINLVSHTWLGSPGNTYEFEHGSAHTSRTEWRNPTASDWTYEVKLRFNNIDMWAPTPHTMFLAAGARTVHERVTTMDIPTGNYRVYLDVYVEGSLIATFEVEPVTIVTVAEVADGILLISYAWWEGAPGWELILPSPATNEWPVSTTILTRWKVENTGGVAANFRVEFMGQSGSITLNPGESDFVEVDITTGGPGSYSYAANLYANGVLVDSLTFYITIVAAPAIELVSQEWLSSGIPHPVGANVARWTENGWR